MDLLEEKANSVQGEIESVIGLCGVCAEGCPNTIYLEDGILDRVQPIRENPDSIVCPRGTRAREVIYSPDRILYPQFGQGRPDERQFSKPKAPDQLGPGLRIYCYPAPADCPTIRATILSRLHRARQF